MNYIVTTTIYEPSEAIIRFSQKPGWKLIVVGDLKTPHHLYQSLENIIYLDPQYQADTYPELSAAIGWNSIQRRNIGFIEAYKLGADIIATVDDDNIPYSNWGEQLYIGESDRLIDHYESPCGFFNPLSVITPSYLRHRGFPIELWMQDEALLYPYTSNNKVLIQADLWDGDPDVDALCRKLYNPKNIFFTKAGKGTFKYTTTQYAPFNSQNTFFAREAIPYYMVIPHIGRMDDIWGGYIAEYMLATRPVFCSPTVKQERNDHDVNKDFINEVIGYTTTLKLLQDIDNWRQYLPGKALLAFDAYRSVFKNLGFEYNERGAV